ncbi:hypothetical protein L873DRAFT_117922 [Choiromyces venosus 120613-1]|uniref:Uncharacterized protein n=1 Tax=Choiromyces venosus 120613-1 TaxID=1336337 RepID=A0A3N4J4B5_9PEZI|nr:hypothetical protein L873DRAFT_117922 [Choiromyces venosus 120613-1]
MLLPPLLLHVFFFLPFFGLYLRLHIFFILFFSFLFLYRRGFILLFFFFFFFSISLSFLGVLLLSFFYTGIVGVFFIFYLLYGEG